MIDHLATAGEIDLLAIAEVVGGLVFTKEAEREWFKRRFSMFQDILRESWVYQEIGQEFFEQGMEQGREEGRRQALQRDRQLLMNFVERHFPEMITLAKQQTEGIKDPDALQSVMLKLLNAQTIEEARKALLEVEQEHP